MKVLLILATMLLAGAVPAVRAADPAKQIAERKAGFKELAKANKALQDEVKRGRPSSAILSDSAAPLLNVGERIAHWFPAGSGPESGVETEASASIWGDRTRFDAKLKDFTIASTALDRAIQAGQPVGLKAAAINVAATCKGCHDGFRVRK